MYLNIWFSQYHLLKRLFFSHWLFLGSSSKSNWLCVHRFMSVLFVVFHWFIYLGSCQHHIYLIILAVLTPFEMRKCDGSSFALLYQDFFGYLGLLWFSMNLAIFFSVSVKNVIAILIKIALNLQMIWWYKYGYFNNINSSDPWTCDVFPLVCVFFNCFHQSLVVFHVQIFHLLC